MDKGQAYQSFWGSFGIPAYDENTVPDEATLPYITYEEIEGNFEKSLYPSASVWYRDTSWAAIEAKCKEIAAYIGYGGLTIPIDGGLMFIVQGSPFSYRASDDKDDIRRKNINIAVEFFTAY